MSSLLPPNTTALERAIEATQARATDLPVPLPDLWNPDTCLAGMLPWLAWTLSVDEWQTAWSEDIKRAVIRDAVQVHRKKGTPWAIKRLLASVGARADLREWWQMDPPGQAHTFEIDVYANTIPAVEEDTPLLGEVATQRMAALINSVKPVRSHYTLRVGVSYYGRLAQGGAIGRPLGVLTSKGTQPLETSLHGAQHWQRGAALSRPSAVATPCGYQRPDRTLQATIPTRPIAAMSRPAVFATAVFRNP